MLTLPVTCYLYYYASKEFEEMRVEKWVTFIYLAMSFCGGYHCPYDSEEFL